MIALSDPNNIFPDVRVGDPVYGMFKYDSTLSPNPIFSDFDNNIIAYTNYPWFEVARMVVDSPHGALSFEKDNEGLFGWVVVADDYTDSEGKNAEDFVYAVQSVLPPPGFTAPSPVVSIELDGITSTLASTRLPTELRLDDWYQGFIWFSDFDEYIEEDESTYVEAEIHTLIPLAPADFNFDAVVDASDLSVWQSTIGSSRDLDADANGDGVVDGADLLDWQRQLGVVPLVRIPSTLVPESATFSLTVAAASIAVSTRRRCLSGHFAN